MKRIGWAFLLGAVGLFLLAGADAPQTLHFPGHRYSIAPLEGLTGGGDSKLLTMFLPATDGFAPNVGVIAQQAPPSIDDYITITQKEFEKYGFKTMKTLRVNDNTAIFEYTGTLKDVNFHSYSKASLNGGEILLATATATEKQWPQVGPQLQACVDTFQRDAVR